MEFWYSISSISTWMKLENIVKKARYKRTNIAWSPLYEITGISKFIEIKSRIEATIGWGVCYRKDYNSKDHQNLASRHQQEPEEYVYRIESNPLGSKRLDIKLDVEKPVSMSVLCYDTEFYTLAMTPLIGLWIALGSNSSRLNEVEMPELCEIWWEKRLKTKSQRSGHARVYKQCLGGRPEGYCLPKQ